MSLAYRLVTFLPILFLSGAVFAQGQVCDVDLDGDIDRADIGLIIAARNQPATEGVTNWVCSSRLKRLRAASWSLNLRCQYQNLQHRSFC